MSFFVFKNDFSFGSPPIHLNLKYIFKIQFQVLTWLEFTFKFSLYKYFQFSISSFNLGLLFKIKINLIHKMKI